MAALGRLALNRALLERQWLLQRKDAKAAAALEHLVGMQAQAPSPPYLGLWTRLTKFAMEDLSRLISSRKAVRLALHRGTIHLVTARDCLRLRPVLQPTLSRMLSGTFGRKLSGLDLADVAATGRKLIEQEPMTLGDLGKELLECHPDRDAFALANVVRSLVPLVQIPPRGLWGESGQAVHSTAELWLGKELGSDSSPDETILRYLAAFGPATVADIQEWSGLTRLREAMVRLKPRLRSHSNENGVELFDVLDAPLPDPDAPAPIRFLPEFDNLVLSHADRSRVISDEHRRVILTRNGLVKATVLVDGFVHGMWAIQKGVLTIEPFGKLTRQQKKELEEEGARLLEFTAPGLRHEIHYGQI